MSPIAAQGGAERALVGVAKHLPAAGFSPTALLLDDGPLDAWFAEVGCPVVRIPAGRWRRVDRTLAVEGQIRHVIRSTGARAVLGNQSKGHIYAGTAAASTKTPAVWWQHGKPRRSAIEMIAARVPTNAIICANNYTAAEQRRRTPRANVVNIQYGIAVDDVAAHQGAGARIRMDHDWLDQPVVGIVGRLQRWKGQHVFLEAAAKVAQRIPQAQFVIVGDEIIGVEADYPAELHRLTEQLGLANRVLFAGHQPSVYPWFDALDVVVHASFGEPFGLVLVEAMALGKPLIAAAEGGPLEIVRDGVDGLLVPPGDAARLADTIVRVLEEPGLAPRLGAEARKRAYEFGEDVMARRWADVLHQVVAGERITQPN